MERVFDARSASSSFVEMVWHTSGALRPPETPTASSRARLDNHDPRPLLALDTQHGKAHRRRHGRSLGVAKPLTGECKASQRKRACSDPTLPWQSEAFTIPYIDPTLRHGGAGHRVWVR